jgi:four helix bundle protein
MTDVKNSKRYDLEERTLAFAKDIIEFVNILPKTVANIEITKQVIRSSGSVGSNYIEANEALSKKDFTMRVKICRKEAKESRYWLRLIEARGEDAENRRQSLINEATELMKIFGSIVEKAKCGCLFLIFRSISGILEALHPQILVVA